MLHDQIDGRVCQAQGPTAAKERMVYVSINLLIGKYAN